jgi:2,3-diketo-5-methylthio-1-phosphopentane phosphatase
LIPAILTDFDDTAAVQNVAEMLLHKFGNDAWQDVRAKFRAGELTLKDYQEIAFNNVRADREAMRAYVQDNANLRPQFVELWEYCQEINSPMAVVSLGLDFYIQALLEKEGAADVPIYCVNTRFGAEGITYYYHHTYPGEPERGNSKGLVVDRYRQLGYHVIYVGDGRSDLEAAERADTVFAHSTLAEECQRQGVTFRPFTDFGGVLAAAKEVWGL